VDDGVALADAVVLLGVTAVAAGAPRRRTAGVAASRPALVDGRPGVVAWRPDGGPPPLPVFTGAGGRITAISIVADPGRLARVHLAEPCLTRGPRRVQRMV